MSDRLRDWQKARRQERREQIMREASETPAFKCPDRRVVDRQTGEVFVETIPAKWHRRLNAWKKDHSQPCPMPQGHVMFEGEDPSYRVLASEEDASNNSGQMLLFGGVDDDEG